MEEAIALDSIQAIAASFGSSFDAEKIIDTVLEKDGTRYYKVRWVKYSWEPSPSFAHLEHLICDFWSQFGQSSNNLVDPPVKQDTNRDIAKGLSEVLARESISTNHNVIPSSILNAVSNIDVNPSNSQTVESLHFQQNLQVTESNTHQLASVTTGGTIAEISLPTQELPQSISQVESCITTALEQSEAEQPSLTEEPKKRRKIPGNCSICGKYFKSTTNIAAHKKLHTEERKFECLECGRKFRRKLHLERHHESHAGIKSFVCNICGNYFSSKWYMQAHALIHTGDKPYKCDLCVKSFNNKANLNKHKLIHANNRPFVCNECGRTYRQSYDLKRHMTVHSVTKNFSCTQCNKSFSRKTYLQRHLLTHQNKAFSCKLCMAKFFEHDHLSYHMKQKHGEGGGMLEENTPETCFVIEPAGEIQSESNTSKQNKVDDITKEMLKSSEHNDFINTHDRPIVFLAVHQDTVNSGQHQNNSSKQIFQETLNIPAVNNAISQKCLIIEGHNLVDKNGVILENCEDSDICFDNTVKSDHIGFHNPDKDELTSSSNIGEKERGDLSQNPFRSIDQDVALSLLASDQGTNYYND